MSDASILITWGQPLPGREAKGVETFRGATEYFNRLKHEGRIDSLCVGLANLGNAERVSGYMLIEGSPAELSSLLQSAEMRAWLLRGQHTTHNFTVQSFDTGGRVPARVEQYLATREELGV